VTGENWESLLRELYALSPRGIQPGLERVRAALAAVGDPQRAFGVVHVAGTNGKGSVAAMVARGIVEGPVGLYTSPHLHSLTERFRVDGDPVDQADVIDAWDALRDRVADVPLSFFEAATVLAFELFRRRGVQIAVLETGLGGRLDATNVFDRPLVTAITRVALDHQAWLGDDLASIAGEKAGILRAGVPCVLAPQEAEVDAVIARRAAQLGTPLIRPTHEGPSEALCVEADDHVSSPLWLRLPGAHQRDNAAVAVGALWMLAERGFDVDVGRAALAEHPGRLERVDGALLDVAHNPDGARALAAHLEQNAHDGPFALVFGAMKDKDWPTMLATLRPHVQHVVLTRAKLERSADPVNLGDGSVVEDVVDAVAAAHALVPDGTVVVAGSAFVVAEARAAILGVPTDPPIAL